MPVPSSPEPSEPCTWMSTTLGITAAATWVTEPGAVLFEALEFVLLVIRGCALLEEELPLSFTAYVTAVPMPPPIRPASTAAATTIFIGLIGFFAGAGEA